MIRASIQLSTKTKVVDLLFLYNFYFGQISCSHMRSGVLGGQTLIKKINSNEFNSVLCCPVKPYARPCRDLASSPATPRVGRRRTSPVALARRPYLRGTVYVFPPLLLPHARGSSRARARAEPSPATVPTILATPLDSPRPKPHDLAPKLLRASTSSVEPHPLPNQVSPPRPPLTTTPSSTPLRRRPPFGLPPCKIDPR